MNKNEKAIFNIILANKLLQLGNPIIRVSKNQHDANKTVFYFNGTNKLYRDLKWIEENN